MDSDKNFDVFKAYISKKKEDLKPKKESSSGSKISESKGAHKETIEMLTKMKRMHREIELKLDESYEKLGMSPQAIKNFLENPNNFTNEEWENLQTQRQGILKKLESELGVLFNPSSFSSLKSDSNPEIISPRRDSFGNLEKTERQRKSKTRGARHNWIPVR